MQCTGISIGNQSPRDSRTLEEFARSNQAETPLGKLLIALTQETVWSSEYRFHAVLYGASPSLYIRHKTFLPEGWLVINESAEDLSVRGVENAVHAYIVEMQDSIRPIIALLHGQMRDLGQVSNQIMTDKARAAIVAAFPELAGVKLALTSDLPDDLYSFYVADVAETHAGPVYVARKVGNEFVGGVAQVNMSAYEWYGTEQGIERGQKLGIFWSALAVAFAARELNRKEDDLWCKIIVANKKPFETGQLDRFIVEKITLGLPPAAPDWYGRDFDVEFGSDNLPIKTTPVRILQIHSP